MSTDSPLGNSKKNNNATDKPKHDKIFRKAMENPIVANEFLNAHLPKQVISAVDFRTLKLEKESFVEADLSGSYSDVVFSAKFHETKDDGYIFLLLEHQSTPHPLMAFRLFKYMINICDRYMTVNKDAKHLPLVYPLVLYNGTDEYKVPRNIWNLFSDNTLAKEFWVNDYQLVNVHDIPDEELKERIWSGILEFFMKHIHERKLLQRWQEIAYLLPQIDKVSIGYDYIKNLVYYTLTFIDQNDTMKLEKLLTHNLNKAKGQEIMGSIAQHWKDEGIEIGTQEGIRIGEALGEARGEVKRNIEIAKKLLSKDYSVYDISELTGLSITDIQKLRS